MLIDKRLSTLCINEEETEEALLKLAASALRVCVCVSLFLGMKYTFT